MAIKFFLRTIDREDYKLGEDMAFAKDLVLVDGSSFLYRAYFASKGDFTTSQGIPTGAVLIIARMLQGLIRDFKDTPIVVIFDAGSKTFRNEMYKEYKSNRPPMPDDLRQQLPYVHELVKALGMPLVIEPGVEADDIMGSYAKAAKDKGINVVLCTGDKDLAQLVQDGISIKDTFKNTELDSARVVAKFGIEPKYMVDFLALKGDKVDNIPGMPGTGDVIACKVINTFGGIYEIKEHLDEVAALGFRGAKVFKQKFLDSFEQIELSYRLATIKTDLDLPIALEDLKAPKKDHQKLLDLYKTLEFQRFYDEELAKGNNLDHHVNLPLESQKQQTDTQHTQQILITENSSVSRAQNYELVISEEALNKLALKLKNSKFMAMQVQTTSLNFMQGRLVGLAFSVQKDEAFYLPLTHDYLGVLEQLSLDKIKEVLGPILDDPKLLKIGHNIKFALLVLKRMGLKVQGVFADTMVMAHLINSLESLSITDLAKHHLDYQAIAFEDVVGKGAKQISFASVSLPDATSYACENVDLIYRLYEVLLTKLEKIPLGVKILHEVEMPFLQALTHMQNNGATLDVAILKEQNATMHRELKDLENQIYTSADEKFNIQSPKQLSHILFEKLMIPYPRKSKVGADGKPSYSTAEEILQEIAPNFDIANLILRYRLLNKLVTSYTEKLTELVVDGRIYTNFNQTGTTTGRLSSSEPNLQNIPARSPEGKSIRKAFTAPSGFKILSADYSQIELRLIAHFTEDPNLIEAFLKGEDIHRHTAAQVLGKDPKDITADERSGAKATNFGLMYGISPHGLSKMTKMSYKDAKNYIEAYFKQYPAVHNYMEKIKDFVKEHGYIETLAGRRVSFLSLGSSQIQRAAIERQAINAPMQGSAADIIKKAMIDIDNWIATLEEGAIKMTLQVHDELIFEVKDEYVDLAKEKIRSLMVNAWTLKVPLEVGIGVGSNWAEAH